MDKEIKIQIVGMGASGISTHISHILAEKGISIDDVVILNKEDFKDKDIEQTKELIKNIPIGKIILINDADALLVKSEDMFAQCQEKVFKFENTYKGLEPLEELSPNLYDKKNFGGHKPSKNRKLRRR